MCASVSVARAFILQRLLPVECLGLGFVGATSLLLECVDVLTVDANEGRGPAVADFVVAQDEPL